MEKFYSDKATRCILIPENLKVVEAMPTKLPKMKCLALVKTTDELDGKTMTSSVIAVELGGHTPFEHLELMSKTVLLPIFSNMMNQQKWGEVSTHEITDCFHSFLSSSTILCGQIKGETRLPMPPLDGVNGALSATKNRISLLEAAIITWTKQIKNVLKRDPEAELKAGNHPTPDVEIEFWRNKASNLNSIFEQLQGKRIRRVLRALDQAKSTYCTTFARLCKEVFAARLEANDNAKHLHTLERSFEKINSEDDFPNLEKLFRPMLHTLLLVWKNSKYYNTPARFVVLMREVCNSLIEQACRYVSGEQIFTLIENDEANVALDQLRTTLKGCGLFKTIYFEYKATTAKECPENPWRIQNNALFMRLDSFLERCHDILDLTQTIVQFTKLAKIEIGSTKGKTLTTTMQQIHEDFQNAVNAFKNLDYDMMDVEAKQFDDDYLEFRKMMKEIERRLGAVICLALDDCPTVYGRFQVLDSFDGELLRRPIIQDELENKYIDLIQAYGQDLKGVQELFLRHRDNPACDTSRNLPPIASALNWCRGLLARVENPMTKLQQMDKTILDREEAKEVKKVQAAIVMSLLEFEAQKIEEWALDVEAASNEKLRLPLVQRAPKTRELTTNFDPTLVCLLREVKYFLLLDLDVPKSALQIFKSSEIFRSWTGNLDLIVNMNNSVLSQLLPVEKPLVDPYLTKFDCVIEKGISTLNWRSEGVDEFIAKSMEQVTKVHGILKTMKDNFTAIEEILQNWDKPIIDRKSKPVEKDEFERSAKAIRSNQFAEIKDSGKQIHSLLKETNKVLRVSNASTDWRCYIEFVNNVIIDGLSRTVTTSLDFLLKQVDSDVISSEGKLPLLELKLDLDDDEGVDFSPPLGRVENDKGVADMMDNVVGSFLQISTLFKRLDTEGTYMREMHSDMTINGYLSVLSEAVTETEEKCIKLRTQFESYSYLWTTDLPIFFHEFCEDATIITEHGTKLLDLMCVW